MPKLLSTAYFPPVSYFAAIAQETQLSKKDAEAAVKAFIDVVSGELKKGEKVQQVQSQEKHTQRKPFDFSMVGLQDGDLITFTPLNIQVKVNGKNKVEHEGRLWSLSAFTGTFMPEHMQNNSGAYQGPKYFTYNNKTLWEIRLEKEN